jgi:hypothetical protein
MKYAFAAALALAASLAGAAQAELPFPLPGQPGPDFGSRPQCTAGYVRSVEQQVAAMQKLRSAGPEAMDRLCTLIELGSAWLGGELPDATRRQLKETLGFDLDLARIATQCRAGQGNLERELISRLGFLRSELVRCNDTI